VINQLLNSPGDPAVLRVLSDALQEQGDPWGEAIRLALDLESTFRGEDAHRVGHRRLHKLQTRYGPSWRARLRNPTAKPLRAPVGMFRAIPSKVNSSDSEVASLLDGPVAFLDFTGNDTSLVPDWPRRAGLVRIEVSHYANTAAAQKLLRPGLNSLRSLSLPFLGVPTLKLLEQADWTSQLERLRLYGNETFVSPPELERLLKLSLPNLKTLELEGLELGLPGAERLASMPWKLDRLTLAAANFGVKGTVALAASKCLSSVKELSLARNTMGPTGAIALATSPHLKQLVCLDLTSTASGGKTLAPFFEALTLPSLKALLLSSCGLKGKALEPLGREKNKVLTRLSELDLSGNLMGDDGLTALCKTTVLSGVHVLQLGGNAIKGPGMAALGKSVLLGKVEELSLGHNKVQNTGAKGLAASKKVGALEELSLGHNWLGVQGLKAILNNPALTRLSRVREGMNNYGSELARSFVKSKTLALWTLGLGPDTTTDVLAEVITSPRLAALELLTLQCAAFDDAMAETLLTGPLAKAATTVIVSRTWCRQLSDAAAQKLTSVLGPRMCFD
jgi:Ran GTPase-activating protein (RanGAP) involved in mRNA processing and transport